jgi:hypothetical protein
MPKWVLFYKIIGTILAIMIKALILLTLGKTKKYSSIRKGKVHDTLASLLRPFDCAQGGLFA